MSPRGPIARWTPELDALLIEHFPTMPLVSLSFLVGRTVPALKVRAHKLRLRRDPAISRATRQAAGKAGYAAAEKRRGGEPVLRKPTPQPPPPPTRPDLRETGFWRIGDDDTIELLLANAEGSIELFYGNPLNQTSWELATDVVIKAESGAHTAGAKRLYGLVPDGDLAYVEERIDTDGDLTPRLSAKLRRHVG